MVDDVRYACDVSVVSRSSRRSSRQRPMTTNSGVDELRQLMAGRASSDKNTEKNNSLSTTTPVCKNAGTIPDWPMNNTRL